MKQIIDRFRSQYTISKLRVRAGDILIVKFKNGLCVDSNYSGLGSIGKALERRNIKDTLVMLVDSESDLQSLSEEEMNKVGWFRKEDINAESAPRT